MSFREVTGAGEMRLAQVQRGQFNQQMRQGLRLLQLSGDALAAEIAAEVASNPLLDGLPAPPARPPREAVAGPGTLVDHLVAQLALSSLDPTRRRLALALIGEVEPDGYLRADPPELARRLGVPQAELTATLTILKGFEPAGIFARDLAECFALQLAERDRLDPLMRALLARLQMLADGRRAEVRVELGCDEEDLADMLSELRRLASAPGHAFQSESVRAVIPEVRVARDGAGRWVVESMASQLPRLVVREGRFERLAARVRRPQDLSYLRERLSAAHRMAELLARRARTVLEVAAELVGRQTAFLDHGAPALRPLTMRQVADALGVHESTISRTVLDKAMLTPGGVVPFRAFLAAPARISDARGRTQRQLVAQIAALIATEDAAGRVLSDEALAHRLGALGMTVARRTVAKHRQAMGHPIASRRARAGVVSPAP